MCTGAEVAIVSALATAGGTYMQYNANNKAQDRQDTAAQAESLRQSKKDEEKFTNFQSALAEVGRDKQQTNIDDATAELEGGYAKNIKDPTSGGTYRSPAASGTPSVVRDYAGKKQSQADDFISLLGNARAKQNAWGENSFDFGEMMLDKQFDQRQLQTDMERSAQIGNYEAQVAGRPGSGAAIGNGLVGLGVAGLGAAGGMGAYDGMFDGRFSGSGIAGPVVGSGATTTAYPDIWKSAQGVNI